MMRDGRMEAAARAMWDTELGRLARQEAADATFDSAPAYWQDRFLDAARAALYAADHWEREVRMVIETTQRQG